MSEEKSYGWDDEIEAPEQKYLPEGIGTFEVLKLDRVRREIGSYGTLNIAKLSMIVKVGDETKTVTDELPLHEKFAWKLMRFFTAIGQRQHGDDSALKPNWANVEGQIGHVKVSHRTYSKKSGGTGKAEDYSYLAQGDKDLDDYMAETDSDNIAF